MRLAGHARCQARRFQGAANCCSPATRIEAVGRNLNATADETIDASDKIVMPGLVNAHMHTWETALRGIGAEWLSADYFKHVHANLATRYNAEDNYVANLIGALAQIDAGVTTLVDWCHNITSMEQAERAVDGLVDSGIRAVFAHGTAKPMGRKTGTPFTHVPHPRERVEALRKGRLASDDGRVTLAMAILGPGLGHLGGGRARHPHGARVRPRLVVAHAAPRGLRGARTATPAWPRRGCSVPTTIWCMARATTPHDCEMVVDSGASLTSTVLVELHHHIGDTMVAAYREAGGAPSLGIDVELYCSGQMFREMQAALLFARGKEIRNNVLRGNSPLQDHAGALARGAGMGDHQRRARVPDGRQDRHALARQEGRHRDAARRRREHGAGLRPGLFDRRDRRRRQCRHRHHRRRRCASRTAS